MSEESVGERRQLIREYADRIGSVVSLAIIVVGLVMIGVPSWVKVKVLILLGAIVLLGLVLLAVLVSDRLVAPKSNRPSRLGPATINFAARVAVLCIAYYLL